MSNRSIVLPFAKTQPAIPVRLHYCERALLYRQKRLQGRIALEPDIDLSAFECRAVIDKASFSFRSGRPTQFRHVQSAVSTIPGQRMPFVACLDGTEASATHFDVTLQEPTIADILDVTEILRVRFSCFGPMELTMIEVSVDFRPRVSSDLLRARMMGVVQRALLPPNKLWTADRAWPRFAFGTRKGQGGDLLTRPSTTEHALRGHHDNHLDPQLANVPPVDATFYLGAQEGPWMIRMMDKGVDCQNPAAGTYTALSDDRKRVRIEVTLQGEELAQRGLREPQDLINFRFTTLQGDFFRFMLPTFSPPTPARTAIDFVQRWVEATRHEHFLRSGVIGLDRVANARAEALKQPRKDLHRQMRQKGLVPSPHRPTRGKQGDCVAYNALNKMVQVALRNLQARAARSRSRLGS